MKKQKLNGGPIFVYYQVPDCRYLYEIVLSIGIILSESSIPSVVSECVEAMNKRNEHDIQLVVERNIIPL